MNEIRSILNLLERKAYKLSNGKMNNINVDRDKPKIQIVKSNTGEVFDLHGESEDELKKYIASKNGWEVFEKGKGEASKGGNEKLDAIVAKYAKPGMSLDDVEKMASLAELRDKYKKLSDLGNGEECSPKSGLRRWLTELHEDKASADQLFDRLNEIHGSTLKELGLEKEKNKKKTIVYDLMSLLSLKGGE